MNHENAEIAYQKVGITGGTGLIGTALVKMLREAGYKVIIFTRKKNKISEDPGVFYSHWDWKKKILDGPLLRSCDYIIHLAGAGIMARRWTWIYKKEIRNSRVLSAKLIIDTLNEGPSQTRAIIGASAIGYYGKDSGSVTGFLETDRPADDFLGEVCQAWENQLTNFQKNKVRTCLIRTGIVMSREGGLFFKLKKLFRYNLVPIPGTGCQILSWIHIYDLCKLYIYCMQNEKISGPVNACGSEPATLYQLMSVMNRRLKKFALFYHIPPFMVRIAKGKIANEILKSATVNNDFIRNSGFRFRFNKADDCIYNLIASR
ncbi:MAG: TIGR01777 family oxidoreductase [Ferruginibacter sp.]|nr:TIGR01777 family oxidoreductase [Bacteroidota bacterium]MCW5916525.1 TIGR01777 family oxidoreductase [Ferruginibacter sp.]